MFAKAGALAPFVFVEDELASAVAATSRRAERNEGVGMLIGQSVLAPTTPTDYYTPWMSRQGDKLTAVIEVIKASSATYSLTVYVQTKNAEDADAALSVIGTGSGTGLFEVSGSGALELVRLRFKLSDTSLGWIHFRSNAPIWQPN